MIGGDKHKHKEVPTKDEALPTKNTLFLHDSKKKKEKGANRNGNAYTHTAIDAVYGEHLVNDLARSLNETSTRLMRLPERW